MNIRRCILRLGAMRQPADAATRTDDLLREMFAARRESDLARPSAKWAISRIGRPRRDQESQIRMELGRLEETEISQNLVVDDLNVFRFVLVGYPHDFPIRSERHDGSPIVEKRQSVHSRYRSVTIRMDGSRVLEELHDPLSNLLSLICRQIDWQKDVFPSAISTNPPLPARSGGRAKKSEQGQEDVHGYRPRLG